jgi:hypothetical protein
MPARQAARKELGFRDGDRGTHSSRTIMLRELELLFEATEPAAVVADYRRAVVDENVLGKPTNITREHTVRKLKALYGLDPAIPVFRAMRRLWELDSDAQPLLAILCAYARDPLLRMTSDAIIAATPGEQVAPEAIEDALRVVAPGRFSDKSITSTSRNILGSWTYSEHLEGRRTKVRRPVSATAASTTYALFLGYLEGHRAQRLYTTIWARLLDAPKERLLDMTRIASRRGWLNFRQVGSVIEVRFPDFLSAEEEGLTRE